MGLLDTVLNVVKIPMEIGQTLVNSNQAKQAQLRQNRMNMQMADYQWSRNLEQWNRQNEYNSPANQMARFKEANLNPNLIYGQGSAGLSSQSPKYEAPHLENKAYTPQIAPIISQWQDYKVREAQIDNLNADRRIKEAKAVIDEARANYASVMAESEATITRQKMWTMIAQGLFSQNQIKHYFTTDDGGHNYQLKPEMKSEYSAVIKALTLRPALEMTRTQADITRLGLENDLKDIELRLQNKYGEWDRVGSLASAGLSGLTKIAGAFVSRGIGGKYFNKLDKPTSVIKYKYDR